VSDRFYVSLTATCPQDALPDVLERMQAAQSNLAAQPGLALDGLSLSFSRDDAEEFAAETVALPAAGPVTSTGPGAPPPDAVDMPIAEPEEQA
jgi:hypothetical protein